VGRLRLSNAMTIDEFARVANTSARNVRAYLERGLLPPPDLVGRTGYYRRHHVERMAAIQRLQREGFSLAAIRVLLDARESDTSLEELVGVDRAGNAAKSGTIDVSTLYPATKFRRPEARGEHVYRRRPLDRVAEGYGRHVMITAPGGSGKSTVAAQLLASLPGASGWVSLEPADNEQSRFWTIFLIGIRTAISDFGDELLGRLVAGADVDGTLVVLADELTAAAGMTLVLDDLHEVKDPEVLRQLRWFLAHVLPTHCRLVICSRSLPSLGVARLALGGQLIHLRTEDISFDDIETGELLGRLGVDLSRNEVEDIAAKTDGWAAGVYLAGLALRNGKATSSVLDALSNPNRQLQEYFSEEVLALIDGAHIAFLQQISILDRFNADLCDAVRGQSDSSTYLDQLDGNMFVLSLDDIGYWKRLHHTFGAVLRTRAASDPDLHARHIRAARWHETHGRIPEAIDHYFRAEAYDDAARLVGDNYQQFVNVSIQGGAVGRWLAKLPPEQVSGSATLSLAAASVAGIRGEHTDMDRWLTTVETLRAKSGAHSAVPSIVHFMRGCFHFGEIENALHSVRSALAVCPRNDPWFPMQCALAALLCSWVDGPTDEVLTFGDEALTSPLNTGQPIALAGAWALKAAVFAARGDAAAESALRLATDIRSHSRIDRVPQAANTWSSTARAHRLLGDADAAAADAQTGYEIIADLPAERDATGAVVPLLIELAHARRLQGRHLDARRLGAEAQRRLGSVRGPGRLPAMLADALDGV
jgi:ATP/maltotriose-dependent transcriptional regulator MalT